MQAEERRYDLRDKRIWIAGHRGMVGRALERRLADEPCEVITVGRSQVDLRRQADVEAWLRDQRPDAIFVAAARVGGILANLTYPAEFLYDNLVLEANIIHAAHEIGVEKLVFLGSSCIYPKHADQPMREDALMTGPLEPTNEWYAIAKIAGIKLCQAYRRQYGCNFVSAMPTNLYGPGDNFDLETSHVLPALIRKVHEAKQTSQQAVTIWGTGKVKREFLYVDDCADALVRILTDYADDCHINVGSGSDLSILELVQIVCDVVGFEGRIEHDLSKPDGTPRKLMDSSKLEALGWHPKTNLHQGIQETYAWYLDRIYG